MSLYQSNMVNSPIQQDTVIHVGDRLSENDSIKTASKLNKVCAKNFINSMGCMNLTGIGLLILSGVIAAVKSPDNDMGSMIAELFAITGGIFTVGSTIFGLCGICVLCGLND